MKFNTLKYKSTSLLKEKGSKFYGYAFPITSKEEVKHLLDTIREEHPKARHFCTALLIGTGDNEYYLTNDDGEPSNSAGAPILGQIRSHGLTNVFIAVVRYFGGTKLGISGLIKAYKETAAQAIASNEIISKEPMSLLRFQAPFSILGEVLSIVDKNNLPVQVDNGNNHAQITIHCKTAETDQIKQLFSRLEISF